MTKQDNQQISLPPLAVLILVALGSVKGVGEEMRA